MQEQDALYRLLDAALKLNRIQDEQELLKEILKTSRQIMQVKASSLTLINPATAKPCYFWTLGEEGPLDEETGLAKICRSAAYRAAKNGKPLMISGAGARRQSPGRRGGGKTQSCACHGKNKNCAAGDVLCVPMKTEQKILGVIAAAGKLSGKFNLADQRLFMAFAAQAGLALENARRYGADFFDPLTGIYGQKFFDSFVERELARAQRYGDDFSLAVIGIDYLRQIYDNYGFEAGDFALSRSIDLVKSSIRTSDILARRGDDAVALFLPTASLEQAEALTERIRIKIQNHNFALNEQSLAVTASVGVTSFKTCQPSNIKNLMESALEALGEAGSSGGNKTVCARLKKTAAVKGPRAH
ncbi:MAG: sensor domain-containing diguanylate cyclase [Elusimicrobia bacterium]|nr:sensor domain-containing diguanylate cyclase [Elusimicrobiota bacterium]